MTKKSIILTAALAAVAAGAGLGATAAHAETTTSWTGTTGEFRDGDARFKMRGRLQYDITSYDVEPDTGAELEGGTRSQVRRAFLGVQGRLTEQWRYKADFVLDPGTASTTSEVGVDDAYLEYAGDTFSLVIGEHNITSPLEDRTSSLDIQFLERSAIINAFGYGRAAGLGVVFGGGNWSLAAAAQGDSLNDDSGSTNANERFSYSARGTWAPIYSRSPEGMTLVHLGLSARAREAGDGQNLTYSTRPANSRGTSHLNAGFNAQSDMTYGVELAAQYNQFGLQAEYITLEAENAAGSSEPSFDGYYVDLFWSLTGENRVYDPATGSFKAIRPTGDGWGHWALTGRYENLDLSDTLGAARGEQTGYVLGLDWVPVDHVRFKLNYASSEIDFATGTDIDADIISLRTQFDF